MRLNDQSSCDLRQSRACIGLTDSEVASGNSAPLVFCLPPPRLRFTCSKVRTTNLVLFPRSDLFIQSLCFTRQYEIDIRRNLRRQIQCFTRGPLRRITSRRYCKFLPLTNFFHAAALRARETPNFWSLTQPTFRFGVLDEKGPRRTMEDSHSYVFDYDGVHGQGFFAVFDGHAGREAADWCGKNFHQVRSKIVAFHDVHYVFGLVHALDPASQSRSQCT